MTAFVEKIAAEIIITLCVGAVLGVISGLLPEADEAAARQNRRMVCRRCGSDAITEAKPKQAQAASERQQ